LRDLSHAACLKSSQTKASYMRMKHVLSGMIGASDEANNDKKNLCYGPVLPQAMHAQPHSHDRVLDPLHVKSRGAQKKKKHEGILGKAKKKRKRKCMSCKKTGHDRRTCKEHVNLRLCQRTHCMVPYDNLFFMIIGVQELQTDVEEVAAFKRTSCFGTKTG
jgi:hypothetical protein